MSRRRADKAGSSDGGSEVDGVTPHGNGKFVDTVTNVLRDLFVPAVKIKSVSHSGEGKANKHLDGQFRWRCKSKRKHQKPAGEQPCADVGKSQTLLCLSAFPTQEEPFTKCEKQNGIDPNDWQAVDSQSDSPLLNMPKVYRLLGEVAWHAPKPLSTCHGAG